MDPEVNDQESADFDAPSPYLLDGIAAVESTNGKNLTGPETPYGTAKGKYQMIDATGQVLFDRAKARGDLEGEYDPYNPDQEKTLATDLVKELKTRFHGDEKLVLAAYNSTPGEVSALQKEYGPTYDDIAPYLKPETQKYVPRVLFNQEKAKKAAEGESDSTSDTSSELQKKSPPTAKGFAEALLPTVSDPEFDTLPLSQKAEKINALYKSQRWSRDTYDVVKKVMTNYWDAAPDEEKPKFNEFLTPPPFIKEGESANTKLAQWKQDQLLALYKQGITPAIFGDALDGYLQDASTNESDAFTHRNRGTFGNFVGETADAVRNVAKGVGYGVSKPVASAIRLGAKLDSRAIDVANSIEAIPELLGKPSRDYIYQTDENGYLTFNGDGSPKTRWQTSAEQAVGQVGSFIAGGAALKTLGYGSAAISGTLFAGNTLTIANDSFRTVYEETGGDLAKSYKAAAFALPAAAVGTAGEYAVIAKWANPVISELSTFNKALYLGNVFTRNAVVGAGANAAMDIVSQGGEILQTGKPFSAERTGEAALVGAVAAGGLSAFQARNAKGTPPPPPESMVSIPDIIVSDDTAQKQLPAPEKRLALPAPEEQGRLGFPSHKEISYNDVRGPGTPYEMYAPTSQEAQNDITRKLQEFQKSKASQVTLTPEQAKNIPPELFSVFQLTTTPESPTPVLTKIEKYLQRDSGTVEGVDALITDLKTSLSKAPSPESVQSLIEERAGVKKQLKAETRDVNDSMVRLVSERQELLQKYEKAKNLTEDQTDPILKRVAKLEQIDAEKNLTDFDNQNENVYRMHERIQPIQDRLDALNANLKDVLHPTYANDLKAKERNLEGLIRKRKELAAIQEQQVTLDAAHRDKVKQEQATALQRTEALKRLGVTPEPTLDFSNGVQVEGHTIVPINEKWYVVDRGGDLVGHPHDYFYDAADSISNPPKEAEKSFVLRNKDKTALSPEAETKIREEVAAQHAENARVAQLKTDTAEQAQKYRDEVYAKEVKAAQKASAKEIRKRKQSLKGSKKVKTVTALEAENPDNVQALSTNETAATEVKADNRETVETLKPNLASLKRRRLSTEKKPLTSNYTKPAQFAEDSQKVVRPQEIMQDLQKVLSSVSKNAKIFEGAKVPRGALGFINHMRDYIGVGRYNDVMTALHEVGHAIDRALIGKWQPDQNGDYSSVPSKVLEALKDLSDTYYNFRGDPSADLRIKEGFSTFFQHYASGQPVRAEILNWYKSDFAKSFPETYKAMENIKGKVFEYYNQSPVTYQQSNIVHPETGLKAKATAIKDYFSVSNLVDKWIDRSFIAAQADKATGGVYRLKDYYDANYKRGRGIADSLLETGIARVNGKTYETLSIHDAFAPAKGKYGELEAYMTARKDMDYFTRGLESGGNIEDAQKTIDFVEKHHPDVVKAANNFWSEMLPTIHRIVGDSSRAGAYAMQKLRQSNLEATGTEHGYYIPFQRAGKEGFNPNAKRTGSTRSKVDPVGNIRDAVESMLTKALQNQVKEQFVDAASGPHLSSIGQYMHEVTGYEKIGLEKEFNNAVNTTVKGDATPSDRNLYSFFGDPLDSVHGDKFKVMPYMDGNKIRFFEADQRIFNMFKDELPEVVNSPFFKYLIRPGAQILRPFATSFRAAFQVKNLIRDNTTAWRYINTGEGTFKDTLMLGKALSNNIVNTIFEKGTNTWAKEAGLKFSNSIGAVQDVRADLQKKFGKNFFDGAEATLNKVEQFISTPEQATRLAAVELEAKRLGIKDLNQPLTPLQEVDLLLAYKRSTTNFGIQGSTARAINLAVPFFTARIAELSRLPGDFRRNPGKAAAYSLALLTYGVYHALAHNDQEWYKEMQPDAKMNAIWYRANIGGVEKAVYIPLESLGALTFGLGQALGNKMGEDKNLPLDYRDLARSYFSMNFSPVNSFADLTTPFGKELLAQIYNWDTFKHRNIVPPALQYQDPRIQYTEYTSELAKSVGKLVGYPPILIDHAIQNTAPAAEDLLQSIDSLTGAKKSKEVSSTNFVINALSRSGTTAGIMDRSQQMFTDKLLESRENKPEETPEEGSIRKQLEKSNTDVSDINTVLAATDDQEIKDQLRQTKRQILKDSISLANGENTTVTKSGVHGEAQTIRKAKTQALGESIKKKQNALEKGALRE